jgi:hypothetical protein
LPPTISLDKTGLLSSAESENKDLSQKEELEGVILTLEHVDYYHSQIKAQAK